QTNDCDFRCPSVACLWAALHEYANAFGAQHRECSCRIARRPATPNKSGFEHERFCERDLFCFSRAPGSCAAKDGRTERLQAFRNRLTSMLRGRFGEVINRAPITGRNEECSRFPGTAA